MISGDPLPSPPDPRLPHRAAEPRSRRRRRGQLIIPPDAEGRTALLASLARRAYPTYELFVYAALCGAILGVGYLLDSQALLVFGILVAPLLLPWIGLLLAAITGSARFFFETLMALLLAALLVFLIGLLSGFAARPFLPRTFNEAFLHSRLWWPDLLILALGAIILTVSFIRSEAKPFLPSVILAYEFFLPLGAGGFGLGSGLGEVWPHGLLVFLVHFAWACLFGLLTLAALRFMPTSAAAFAFSGAVGFILLVVLVILMSAGVWTPSLSSSTNLTAPAAASGPSLPESAGTALPVGPSPTPLIDTATPAQEFTPTASPVIIDFTPPPTEAPTVTLTFEPTPIYAQVHAPSGGAFLRETPGGKVITTLDNLTFVEILPETQQQGVYTWSHVIAIQGETRHEGWMVLSYLETATAAPGLLPTATTAAP
jgi:hypothetical protein